MPQYVRDFSALTTGEKRWNKGSEIGTSTVISYCFLTDQIMPSWDENPDPTGSWFPDYSAVKQKNRKYIEEALSIYEEKCGLRFVEVSNPAQASLQFLANDASHLTSWAYFPEVFWNGTEARAGSSFITITSDRYQQWSLDWSRGSATFNVILHEIGHAIGLYHPHEGILLAPDLDNHDNTIMSYNWDWSGYDYGLLRDTLAPLDIQALRYLYGANSNLSAGWNDGAISVTGTFGDDRIVASRADTKIFGGNGNDHLRGLQGKDTLYGGGGHDRLMGGDNSDRLEGNYGNDTIYGNSGADAVYGGTGDDFLFGDAGNDTLFGHGGHDRLVGGAGNDRMEGGFDIDFLNGLLGNDQLIGQAGNDSLVGYSGSDTLSGGAGNDSLLGQDGYDALRGGYGNDTLRGGNHDDFLEAGVGHDSVFGENGTDRLYGGNGDDRLYGQSGNDYLNAAHGNDLLVGGTGNDTLIGGMGADIFFFYDGSQQDWVTDWQDGLDRINLKNVSSIKNYDDLEDAVVARNGNLHITLGAGGNELIVMRMRMDQLSEDDFIF